MSINSYQDAVSLYSTSRINCHKSKHTLKHALVEMQQAVQKFQKAQRQLTEAEFQVGKA
jgi:hypothetical protein